jgi:hypothetical protein
MGERDGLLSRAGGARGPSLSTVAWAPNGLLISVSGEARVALVRPHGV